MVLSSHLYPSASTNRNGEHSPGACVLWGLDHAGARGMAMMGCLVGGVGMRGSKESWLLAPLVMVHNILLTPECTCNISGHSPRVRAYGDGDAGTLVLLQPAVSLLHALGYGSRSPGSTCITPFQNSLPGTAMASTCLVPHCRDTGTWADSLREVGAPVLGWRSPSCSISFPHVTYIPVPPVSFSGICHE